MDFFRNLFGKPRVPVERAGRVDANTYATNPGGLEVDDGVYVRCFSDRPLLRDQFRKGDANPGIVVAANPWLVAVTTDLAHTAGYVCPVVKVVQQPLDSMTGGPPRVGMRLATLAMYQRGNHAGRWETFDPIVINCVSGNLAAIARVFDTFTPDDWNLLQAAVKSLPLPMQPGQHPSGPWLPG